MIVERVRYLSVEFGREAQAVVLLVFHHSNHLRERSINLVRQPARVIDRVAEEQLHFRFHLNMEQKKSKQCTASSLVVISIHTFEDSTRVLHFCEHKRHFSSDPKKN